MTEFNHGLEDDDGQPLKVRWPTEEEKKISDLESDIADAVGVLRACHALIRDGSPRDALDLLQITLTTARYSPEGIGSDADELKYARMTLDHARKNDPLFEGK